MLLLLGFLFGKYNNIQTYGFKLEQKYVCEDNERSVVGKIEEGFIRKGSWKDAVRMQHIIT